MITYPEVGLQSDGNRYAWRTLGSQLLLAIIRGQFKDRPVSASSRFTVLEPANGTWIVKAAQPTRKLALQYMTESRVLLERRIENDL